MTVITFSNDDTPVVVTETVVRTKECPICADTFNNSFRKEVACPKCNGVACRECVGQSIISSPQEAQCMHCQHPWPRKFIAMHMTNKFLMVDYRDHCERVTTDREISLLPTAMPYVEARARIKELKNELDDLRFNKDALIGYQSVDDVLPGPNLGQRQRAVRTENRRLHDAWKRRCYFMEREIHQIHLYKNGDITAEELATYITQLHSRDAGRGPGEQSTIEASPPVPKTFLSRGHCPKAGCNSFINEGWKCIVCDTKVCKTCMEVEDDDHECDKDIMDNIALIRKECKPCPSCRVRVFRIHGCDQMFCTNCNTGFCWRTGRMIASRNVHNPHYHEWQARNQAAAAVPVATPLVFVDGVVVPPVPTVVPVCGATRFGIMEAFKEGSPISQFGHRVLGRVSPDCQAMIDRMQIALQRIDYRGGARHRHENHTERKRLDLRVRYITNELSHAQFVKLMQRAEKAIEKHTERCSVFVMHATVTLDILAEFCARQITREEAMAKLEELRVYTTQCIIDMQKWFNHTPLTARELEVMVT